MNYLLLLVILIKCLSTQGVLEWTVVGKVTEYGQNVTLFCNVPNCCPEDSGWDRWTPVQQTLFIDVKSGRSNKKYDGKIFKDGYTLIIQNLTENDLNVSYSCLYGVTFGARKFLLEEEVFTFIRTSQPNGTTGTRTLSQGELAAVITVVNVLVSVAISIFIFGCLRSNQQAKLDDTETKLQYDIKDLKKKLKKIEAGNITSLEKIQIQDGLREIEEMKIRLKKVESMDERETKIEKIRKHVKELENRKERSLNNENKSKDIENEQRFRDIIIPRNNE